MVIESRKNSVLKKIRRLRRSPGEEVLLEGPHLVAEALEIGLDFDIVLATPEFLDCEEGRRLQRHLPRPPLAIKPELLDEVTDSDSPRGVVATARFPRRGVETLPVVTDGVYLYLEGMQDPGNLGALARVSEASGASGLVLSPGCVHPNHPRAQRAAAGSLLRLPVAVYASPTELDIHLVYAAPRWAALVPHGGQDLYGSDLDGALILALGAEGPGLSETLRSRAGLELTIPLHPPVESLNVTVAASVVLFEIKRRRRR
jgi:TrmH family RNA methyltransferase